MTLDATKRPRSDTAGAGSSDADAQPEPKRFRRLVEAIDRALSESRKSIDTRAAVAECYGEDASIFASGSGGKGGGNSDGDGDGGADENDDATDMLSNLLDGVIDRVNDRLRTEIHAVLEREDVCAKLEKLESLIDEYDRRERETKEAEEDDRRTAREAAGASRLPAGVSPSDVLSYHAYRVKVEERDRLVAEIASVEAENEALRRQIEKGRGAVSETVADMEAKGKDLERTADACSFSGVG